MPIIVLLSGASASGKSLVAKKIDEGIHNVTVLSMDNFYKGLNEQEKKNPDEYNFDEPSALDYELFIDCVKKLKSSQPVEIPTYDFKTHSRNNDKINIEPTSVIVVEGILVLCNEELRKLADYKVFIDASPETRLFRRIQRDVEERGRCIDSVKKQYKKFVIPSYDTYI